jgi:catechol 2,3-dioxygenase-like lactoylglutathione lyase family enzyme
VRLHHLALRTADLERAERFYVGLLGLRVLRRDEGRSVWLDAAGTILMLERRDTAEPEVDRASKELVCFAIDADEGPTLVARLEAAGIAREDGTPYTMYFRDPDGRRIGASSYPTPLR